MRPSRCRGSSPFAATSQGTYAEPWALAFEPGTGRIFITEKRGTAKLYDPASGTTREVTGLPEVAYGGQGGLGDVAFAPDYASSRTIYLSWAQAASSGARRAVVGRGTLSCEAAGECRVEGLTQIWQQSVPIESPGHFSHKIAFSPDGRYLFVASGDRMQGAPAQDLTNNLGTVVRLTPDGRAAPGNPFADRGGATAEIWSYGHRNILGIGFDPQGQLWEIEHGPAGGDELNRVERGANYGWPTRSNGDNYDGSNIPDHTADDGFAKPAISWDPVIAPGDMIFYTGDMFADWRGQVLAANLRTTSISRIAADASANSASEEARYEFPHRLRDIAQAPDGAVWVIEDGEGGRLIRLTPR
ncbi:PQQ-dependent sugar dehydrogenase [Aurantiacibacter arachoides]|uniref:PQQ-dependent sugar dehydrogenase n=1 Tax=Aurantiacibacter arachoides TaxID=1850444 RepID=UPI0019BD4D1E|nr:PQQ-dependent sugar dehydrogenase [Aurantiacibacter arachoides]GGD48487.1 dehydrogenase [Aurantiacibacter arachoides]